MIATLHDRARSPDPVITRGAIAGLLFLALPMAMARAADPVEHWTATSDTATSITGNITFSTTRLVFQNGRSLALSLIGPANDFKALGDTVNATLYRVSTPADVPLKNGNHLCGSAGHPQPVTYIVIWNPTALPGDKAPRSMAPFSGNEPPHSTSGASLCGTYNYDADG